MKGKKKRKGGHFGEDEKKEREKKREEKVLRDQNKDLGDLGERRGMLMEDASRMHAIQTSCSSADLHEKFVFDPSGSSTVNEKGRESMGVT